MHLILAKAKIEDLQSFISMLFFIILVLLILLIFNRSRKKKAHKYKNNQNKTFSIYKIDNSFLVVNHKADNVKVTFDTLEEVSKYIDDEEKKLLVNES